MTDVNKPVAKSLHTVTVIVQVTRHFIAMGNHHDTALQIALGVLGLKGRPDPYGLEAQALKQVGVK